jgi:hypothetical protein
MSGRTNKRLSNDKSLLPISVGDRVRVEFFFGNPGDDVLTGKVLNIERRYGHGHSGNFKRVNPLITLVVDGNNEIQHMDQQFVKQVLEPYRGPRRPNQNIFRGAPEKFSATWEPLKRGLWRGDLPTMVRRVLAAHHAMITQPLDERKLIALFRKDAAGLVDVRFLCPTILTVKADPFKRWVKQNYSKFLATTAELDAISSARSREFAWNKDEVMLMTR